MRKPVPIRLFIAVLLTVSAACAPNLPAPTQDLHFLETAVMSTMISGATQTALAGFPVAIQDTATPGPTFTPSVTPSATLTSTPVFTPTPVIPLVSVSVPTNCRVGPGRIYDRVGGLQVGEVAEVVGRNDAGNYWYIRNPSRDGFCWLWGEYATVTGNFAALPVFTPPPTPTPMPAFEAVYDGLETCGTNWWADLDISNTGGITFESISMTVTDTDTGIVASLYSDVFNDIDGCTDTFTRERLNPGDTRIVSGPTFTYNPTGHQLRSTITLCSSDGQNGTCITESIRFTP